MKVRIVYFIKFEKILRNQELVIIIFRLPINKKFKKCNF